MTAGLTIGQLAKAAEVNVQTIRYYERRRLLHPADRRPSGYRLYADHALQRLRFIKNAQGLGFTLREIVDLLGLEVRSTAKCGDVQRRAEAKLAHVKSKVQDLHALVKALDRLIRACRAGRPTAECPILNSLRGQKNRTGRSSHPERTGNRCNQSAGVR